MCKVESVEAMNCRRGRGTPLATRGVGCVATRLLSGHMRLISFPPFYFSARIGVIMTLWYTELGLRRGYARD